MGIKIKFQGSRIIMLILIGALYLTVAFVCAETAEEYFNRGNIYIQQGNFAQAISEYTKAIKINPNDAQAYSNRGVAYDHQGNFAQAISDYTMAIKINPNDSEAYSNRGIAYALQGNLAQAISDYTKHIEINPYDAKGYSNRGVAYYAIKEYDKAWLDVHKAEGLELYVVDPGFLKELKKASGRDR